MSDELHQLEGLLASLDASAQESSGASKVSTSTHREADAADAAGEAQGIVESAPVAEVSGPLNEPAVGAQQPVGTEPPTRGTRLRAARPRGKRLVRPEEKQERQTLTPQQRLLILDTWQRSGLPAGDFAALVGLSKHTLYAWKKQFAQHGPAGLMEQPRGAREGSRLPELTKRTILMMKQQHPEWGCQRISDMLLRGPALPASASAVARVLHEAGYELEESATRPHPDKPRHFERAKPNQLWQSDLFTFVLKRQNRRVYLVAFLDDHSRFIVSYGLHASQSAALVLEVLRAGIASYGTPQEVLTDNGSQYITWRGKSAFARELEQRGIRHVVAAPRRPQTLGKIERFWGTLWRECVESSVFLDLEDARRRIGLFIDHYNLQRPHQGIEGLVPADRFFGAAPEVLRSLRERLAANALELARNGLPKPAFYVTGQVAGQSFSVHAEGERVILTREGQQRQAVDLVAPATPESAASERAEEGQPASSAPAASAAALPQPICPDGSPAESLPGECFVEPPPGVSPLDEGLRRVDSLGRPFITIEELAAAAAAGDESILEGDLDVYFGDYGVPRPPAQPGDDSQQQAGGVS